MKRTILILLACALGRGLWATPGAFTEAHPPYDTSPGPQAADPAPMPTMVPFGRPAPYPSLDPGRGVTATSMPAALTPPARVWEPAPTEVLALTSHGAVLGLSYEHVLAPWFSAQGFVGVHDDSRYYALAEGVGLRLYPWGKAPEGLYLEGQDDFVQENANLPAQGTYQAQRIGVALGWQWLLSGSVSVGIAGALYQEGSLYASHPEPSIGSNHDGSSRQMQSALDLSLGWGL